MVSRTIEFYDDGRTWRNTVSNDSVVHSANPDKITFSHVSPQDSISYTTSTDKIHYTRGTVLERVQRRSAFKKVFVAPPPTPTTDPDFSNVVALLHLDGTDGETTLIDETGRAWSRTGTGISLRTDEKKFGTASLKNTDVNSDFNTPAGILTGTDLFTVEGWVYLLGAGFTGAWGINGNALVTGGAAGGGGEFGMFIEPSNKLLFDFRGGNSGDGTATGTTVLALDTWYHFAATWDGTTHRGFINGNVEYAVAKTFGWKNTGQPVRLCRLTNPSFPDAVGALNGYLDEVRITKGVARYTATFTPPADPFPNT